MQCYESQAMRLMLHHDAQAVDPALGFDELALDAALAEFGIESAGELMDLRPNVLAHLVERSLQLCHVPANALPACGQYCPEVSGPVSLQQSHDECAALHGCHYGAEECPLDGWLRIPTGTRPATVRPAA